MRMIHATVDTISENAYRRGKGDQLPCSDERMMLSLNPGETWEIRDGVLYINNHRWVAVKEVCEMEMI
jgi:hypothetical protein